MRALPRLLTQLATPTEPRRGSAPLTSRSIAGARFTAVRLREGYDRGEVDQFLDHAEATLAARETGRPGLVADLDPLTAGDVHQARFTPARLRKGYDIGEVDRFLDRLARTLAG